MDLKEKIKDKGIKISWIAEKVGISQPLLSMYLNKDRKFPVEVEEKVKAILQ